MVTSRSLHECLYLLALYLVGDGLVVKIFYLLTVRKAAISQQIYSLSSNMNTVTIQNLTSLFAIAG